LRGLIARDPLACALDVQDEWVVRRRNMEESMVSITRTSTVETVEAHIKAGGVIDRVKALRAVFPVYRLCWSWRMELWIMLAWCRWSM
jgi:hypothetical protein